MAVAALLRWLGVVSWMGVVVGVDDPVHPHTLFHNPPKTNAEASCASVRLSALANEVADETLLHYCQAVRGVHTPSFINNTHEPLVVYAVRNPRRASGSLFFDIGANGGVYSTIALSGNFSGALAFEPQAMCADNILFTEQHNHRSNTGAAKPLRIYNVGLGLPGSFDVYDHICGMNWQGDRASLRKAKARSVSLSTILPSVRFPTATASPAFLKIDTDGAEVNIMEMLLKMLPPRGGAAGADGMADLRAAGGRGFPGLPEMYVEIDPLHWAAFGRTYADGIRIFSALSELYSEIYFFNAVASSCEGAGHRVLQFTEPPALVPERPLKRRDLRILRVTDFSRLLQECVAHQRKQSRAKGNGADWGQMNLWFVPP